MAKVILRFLKIYFLFLIFWLGLGWFVKLVLKPSWYLSYLRNAPINLIILEGYGLPFLFAIIYFLLSRKK